MYEDGLSGGLLSLAAGLRTRSPPSATLSRACCDSAGEHSTGWPGGREHGHGHGHLEALTRTGPSAFVIVQHHLAVPNGPCRSCPGLVSAPAPPSDTWLKARKSLFWGLKAQKSSFGGLKEQKSSFWRVKARKSPFSGGLRRAHWRRARPTTYLGCGRFGVHRSGPRFQKGRGGQWDGVLT